MNLLLFYKVSARHWEFGVRSNALILVLLIEKEQTNKGCSSLIQHQEWKEQFFRTITETF